ncbi:MAG: heat-inducible transcriptional repressor HrcA [Clostridiales bacterium]|jgi:heat-inducible transcriptional repressor|nr:heat-inducible transcriptional repressor HrcA [Clostridiales bacterium]
MMLNERKIKILEAIINDYIAEAMPIGSRTIAKKYDLGISSATIRNEMSDLEDMGYIVQPHASAGRVPSDKGYRLYVDRLMHHRALTPEETDYLRSVIINNIGHVDYLMRETAKAISVLTNYTTIASEPEYERTKIKHIQLMPMDEKSIVLVIITDNKAVRNHVINMAKAPDYETLTKVSNILNETLSGKVAGDIAEFSSRGQVSKEETEIIDTVINTVKAISNQENSAKIYTSGVNNILEYPEFSDINKARSLFKTFEEKEVLITLLGNNDNEKVEVVIGSENQLEQMKDCSIIKASYSYGKKSLGSIGIIGPTRMDYTQVVSVLYGIIKNVNALLYAITHDST